jgi:phospholipase C
MSPPDGLRDDLERFAEGLRDRVGHWFEGVERHLLPAPLQRAFDILTEHPAPTPTGTVTVDVDASVDNLDRVEHIVVLMLENRSFDSMLGYLSLGENAIEGLDGLTLDRKNAHDGRDYPVHPATRTAWDGELEDPCHGPECIDKQMSNEMGGFVDAYADYVAEYCAKNGMQVPPNVDLGLVMGYFTAEQLPVFDHLAREYCICDAWFSSVPGATWPNRLYSLAGRCDGDREDREPPVYNLATFPRYLDARNVGWSWYSFDPGTLRLADPEYRLSHHRHFSYVDQRKLSSAEREVGKILDEEQSFLDDCAAGILPPVSWIDPHFKDISVFGPNANDDHPPSDVTAGQALVLDVYNALRNGPLWEKTMLVITYDEHGGIYDHVVPPEAEDDDPAFRRYGVRVPALIVSPLVMRGVSHTRFDHTSIIKTILLRFCRDRQTNEIPDMGLRVTRANHLGGLITGDAAAVPDEDTDRLAVATAAMKDFHMRAVNARFAPLDPAPDRRPLNDLQRGFAAGVRALRAAGLPSGHP